MRTGQGTNRGRRANPLEVTRHGPDRAGNGARRDGPRYKPVIEGESFPEATEITATMLEPCYPALTGTRPFYRSYSAVLHGQVYGLMNFMTPAIQADGRILLSWQLRGSVLYGAVEVALLSFREPFKLINQHMGWGRLEYDLWHARAGRALNMVTRRGALHLWTAMSATSAGWYWHGAGSSTLWPT